MKLKEYFRGLEVIQSFAAAAKLVPQTSLTLVTQDSGLNRQDLSDKAKKVIQVPADNRINNRQV
jgi:aspartate 1-decarboxylase